MKTRFLLLFITFSCFGLLTGFTPARQHHFKQASPLQPAPFTCAQPTGLVSYLNPPQYEYTFMTWNAVPGATSYTYELYYSYFTPGSFMFLVDEAELASITYPIASYTSPWGYYDWRVRTNCSGGSSAWSYGSFYIPYAY